MNDLAASYAACREVSAAASSNFYLAFWFLPTAEHEAMCALYAFLRHGDDLCDADRPIAERRTALAAWRQSLQRALAGEYDHPILPALAATLRRYDIPQDYLFDVLDGFDTDLGPVRMANFGELDQYCYRVAGAVGLACLHIWGARANAAIAPARACGLAFQLTNILRDLAEDAAADRIYLPADEMTSRGYSAQDLRAGVRNAALRDLLAQQFARAHQAYRDAEALVGYLPAAGRRVWLVMFETYRHLLGEIERRGVDLLASRTELNLWTRIWIACGALWRSGLGEPSPPRRESHQQGRRPLR